MARQNLTPSTAAYVVTVAAPTGVEATDAAAVQAAHDALPATGGLLQLRSGAYNLGTTGLTISKPSVTLAGYGGSLEGDGTFAAAVQAATTLQYSGATGVAVTVSQPGVIIRDLAVVNTAGSQPSAGAGISCTSASQSKIQRVSVVGFYNNIEMKSGQFWTITDSHNYDPVNYGLFIDNGTGSLKDHGAFSVLNTVFTNLFHAYSAAAAIRWRSGGGGRFIGNQINGTPYGAAGAGSFVIGIDLAVADNVSTGDFQITGNDINNCSTACVRLTAENQSTPTSCVLTHTTIAGNTFNAANAATGVVITVPTFAYYGVIKNTTITSNTFGQLTHSITANWATNLHIGPNAHDAISGVVISIGPGGGTYNNGVIGFQMESQFYADDAVTVFQDWRSINNTGGQNGVVTHRYRRQVIITAVNTWQTQFTIGTYPFKGGSKIKVTLAGDNGATGGVFMQQERSVVANTNNATPTVAAIGTDTAVGAGVAAIQYVGSSNQVQVQVQVPTGAADANFNGFCEIEVIGNVTAIAKGV